MKSLKYFAVFLGFFLTTVSSWRPANFYRRDYKYMPEHDAFFKLHFYEVPIKWEQAFFACENEGATLFYPEEPNSWKIVNTLAQALETPPNITDVFIGIHNKFNPLEFVTVDGHSAPYASLTDEKGVCLMMNTETGGYIQNPCAKKAPAMFVCKRVDKKPCPTIDLDYKFSAPTQKCYKIHNTARNWEDAMQTCYLEGGTLTVEINPREINIINENLVSDVYYFTGIRDLFYNGKFYTEKGEKVDDKKINKHNEQDDFRYCAAAVRDLNGFYTTGCHDMLPFICEMQANI